MKTFFDLLITLGILVTAIPAVILLYSRAKRKRSWEYNHKTITLIISIILLIGTLVLIYGSFVEPRLLVTNRYEIDLEKIEKPITIVFIADFQVGKYKQNAWVKKTVQRTLELQPDLVFLGGDQVDNGYYEPQETSYLEPLKKLAGQIPTYAIHGNHEYGIGGGKSITNHKYRLANVSKETQIALKNLGITFLSNKLEKITVNDQSFYLFGGDAFWAQKLDYSVLEQRKEDLATLALIHNPVVAFEAHNYYIDLMLSGHTHGGQVRLPFIGPVARVDKIIPGKWYQGLHEYEGMKFLVTSGVGETGTRARLFNPPEIVLLTIK